MQHTHIRYSQYIMKRGENARNFHPILFKSKLTSLYFFSSHPFINVIITANCSMSDGVTYNIDALVYLVLERETPEWMSRYCHQNACC